MSGAPKTEDFEADVDYVDEDDDDDEDEDDFIPGADEVEEEDEDDIVPLLDGYLYVDDSQSLHYQGDGFHLSSSEPPAWNVTAPNVHAAGESMQVVMTGPCDFESAAESKATPRKMKVTFTVVPAADMDPLLGELAHRRKAPPHADTKQAPLKGDDDEDDDGKVKAAPKKAPANTEESKVTALVHRVFGHQIDTHGGDVMEFVGVFYPPKTKEEQVSLTCQVRIIPTAAPAPAAVAAAVASPHSARIDNEEDDDDEEDEDYEEGVDYDELIALHEDAGLSVDAVQKRYRGSTNSNEADEGRPKRAKKPPPPNPADDDDDDYGF